MIIFVLFFLFALFFAPFLLVPFILFFLLLLLFLPFKFTIDSIFNLVTVPAQLYKIATNPVLRKNHSLEHATVNILEKEYGCNKLAGYAEENGFYILGINDISAVEEAAQRGLALMKSGRKQLAIHTRCGTSMLVANFISAVIFLLLLLYTGYFSILNMVIAIIIANLLGPYLGQILQRFVTTTPEIEEMEIISASYNEVNYFSNQRSKIFVRTEIIPYLR